MTRGTTPKVKFTVSQIVPSQITKLSIVFNQYGVNIIERDLAGVTIGENYIEVQLSEADTLKFDVDKEVEMQIRCEIGANKLASNIMTTTVDKILKEGAL